MGLVNHEYYLHVVIDVQKPLNEEGVGDLILFTLIVAESGAIIKSQVLNDGSRGDGGLGVLLMTNFNDRGAFTDQLGLQPFDLDHKLASIQEVQNSTFSHASISHEENSSSVSLLRG